MSSRQQKLTILNKGTETGKKLVGRFRIDSPSDSRIWFSWKRVEQKAGKEIGVRCEISGILFFLPSNWLLYTTKRLGNRGPPKRWIVYAESHAVLVATRLTSYALLYHYSSVIDWKWRRKLPASTSFVYVLAANVRPGSLIVPDVPSWGTSSWKSHRGLQKTNTFSSTITTNHYDQIKIIIQVEVDTRTPSNYGLRVERLNFRNDFNQLALRRLETYRICDCVSSRNACSNQKLMNPYNSSSELRGSFEWMAARNWIKWYFEILIDGHICFNKL